MPEVLEVLQFFDQMEKDCKEGHAMLDAEEKLASAIDNYEKVFGVKIKPPFQEEKTHA